MSQSTEKKKSLPLHFQILIAMLVGTVIGIAVNPGDVALTENVTASLYRDGDGIRLQERDSASNQAVYTETFASAAVFADSYPKLAEALGDRDTREIEVTNARARFTYSMSGVQITWHRSHDGVPAVSQIAASGVVQLPVFWRPVAAEHSSGIASTITTLAKSIGDLFLRLLKMVTVPLILTSLVTGVTGLGSQGRFGRMFGRTIFYY
ncbi:MAG TPA: cation:dicarboxylase symporter family transporter, partial [Fuerstia sp.]|nr:cation:dicarboxylase symporter family transporter [Fuerstiella sp.]